MRKLIVPALIGSLLSGCAVLTPAERSVQMQNEVNEMIQIYGSACEKLGYKQDTDPWRECILQLNTSKAIERYSTRQSSNQCWAYRGFLRCSSF